MPQDWLNAAIVSMGSMGVVYSMVLEVVPQFGVHEVVVQTTWETTIWNELKQDPVFVPASSRWTSGPSSASRRRPWPRAPHAPLSPRRGLNDTGITAGQQPLLRTLRSIPTANRDARLRLLDRQPRADGPPADRPPAAGRQRDRQHDRGDRRRPSTDPKTLQKLRHINTLGNPWDPCSTRARRSRRSVGSGPQRTSSTWALTRVLTPMIGSTAGRHVAEALLTGLLNGLLGTAHCTSVGQDRRERRSARLPGRRGHGDSAGDRARAGRCVHFLQKEIMDRSTPSARSSATSPSGCAARRDPHGHAAVQRPRTHPYSVMIEVVAFGTPGSIQFLRDLQDRTIALSQRP